MTADEWEAAAEPQQMLRFVRDTAGDRRLRLFACACLRRVLPLLSDKADTRKTIEFAERYADGLATRNELHGRAWGRTGRAFAVVLWEAFDAAETAALFGAGVARMSVVGEVPLRTADSPTEQALVEEMMSPEQQSWAEAAEMDEQRAQAHLLRDIVPNPFRPIAFHPRWRTADTVGLARGIYEERAFDRLPLLADALQDAGCADEQVLGHCRSDGPHVRGCHVVDLLLGRE